MVEAVKEAVTGGCALVIFGGAGDLSRRKLIPGLWNLALDGDLPDDVCIVGFARTDLDDARFRIESHDYRIPKL